MPELPVRGEVWWCETPEIGRRPVIVLSRYPAIASRRRVLVTPCSRTVRGLPSEVILEPGDDPVPDRCAATLDVIHDLSTGLLVDRLGALTPDRMRAVCAALAVATGCDG